MKQGMLVCAGLLLAAPANAQYGALDMGLVTGDAAMSHIQQSEERRARAMRRSGASATPQRSASSAATARANCARKAQFRARLGADHPKIRQIYQLCAMAGY